MEQRRNWKLSPSDFAFLWEDCKRCFYLKVVHQIYRPRSPMPKIFTVIDSEMKAFYADKRIETIADGAPAGKATHSDEWVQSKPIKVPGRTSTCFIRGIFDTTLELDDGSHGVVDFKTCERKSHHIPLYSRQLHAYAYALENPAPGSFALSPITRLGLLVFEPTKYCNNGTDCVGFTGNLKWIEIPRDDSAFMNFLQEVLDVLDSPDAPPANPNCEWCKYRRESRQHGL